MPSPRSLPRRDGRVRVLSRPRSPANERLASASSCRTLRTRARACRGISPTYWSPTIASPRANRCWPSISRPGGRAAVPAGDQAAGGGHRLPSEVATVDRVSPVLACREALRLLRSMANDAVFQPEAPEVPIQILGVLESAALEFDHLWIMGLT